MAADGLIGINSIKEGEELSYNYGYEYEPESYHDDPCYCGAEQCCGYILAQRYWSLLPRTSRVLRV